MITASYVEIGSSILCHEPSKVAEALYAHQFSFDNISLQFNLSGILHKSG